MAFKIGDKVEVYRRQDRGVYAIVEKGYKGYITRIVNSSFFGKWACISSLDGRVVGVKLTYLKHIKE